MTVPWPDAAGPRSLMRTATGNVAAPGNLGHALMGVAETNDHTSEEGDVRRASGVAADVRGFY